MRRPIASWMLTAVAALAGCGGGGSSGGSPSTGGNPGSGASAGSGGSGGIGAAGAGGIGSSAGAGGSGCVDADGDGHTSTACGGDDCDDANDAVHAGASETITEAGTIPLDSNQANTTLLDVALGPNDSLYLLYVGTTGLDVATWANGSWSNAAIGVASTDASLAVDAEGTVHLAIRTGTTNAFTISYASNAGGSFAVLPVTDLAKGDASASSNPDIAIDGSGAPHLIFSADGTWHATVVGGVSQKSLVTAEKGTCFVTSDPTGVVHLARISSGAYVSSLTPTGWTDGPTFTAINPAVFAFEVGAPTSFHFAKQSSLDVTYYLGGSSGPDDELVLDLHRNPQLRRGPDGTVHLFARKILETYHTVGSSHVYRSASGWKTKPVHETKSYIQEELGLVIIDSQGRLHRLQPTGRHTYWDAADSDCDGLGW